MAVVIFPCLPYFIPTALPLLSDQPLVFHDVDVLQAEVMVYHIEVLLQQVEVVLQAARTGV